MPKKKGKFNPIENLQGSTRRAGNDSDSSDDERPRKDLKRTRGERKAKFSMKQLISQQEPQANLRGLSKKKGDSSSEDEFQLINIDEIVMRDPPVDEEVEGIPKSCTITDRHGKKEYKCGQCPKSYLRPSKLRKHFRKHTGEQRAKWYNCEHCSKQFSTALKLDKHLIRRHANELRGNAAGSSSNVLIPEVVIKKEPIYFPTDADLDIKQEPMDEYDNYLQPKTELFEYTPPRPNSAQSSDNGSDDPADDNWKPPRDLKEVIVPEVSVKCQEDQENDSDREQKKKIKAKKERTEEEIAKKRARKAEKKKAKKSKEKKNKLSRMELWRMRPHKCPYCIKRYAAKEKLDVHVEMHTRREKPFPCDQCEMSFDTFGALRFHIGKFHVDRNCKVCGELMATLTDQLRHKTMHQDKEYYKYECDICNKRFARQSSVKIHKDKIHSGGPLKCLNCPLTFTKPVYLLGHALEKHNDDRPFGCTICSYRSNRQYHVDIHERSHSLDMQYNCELCGRFFTNMSNFNTHKKQHENNPVDIDYRTCKECGKVFARRTYLNKHMKIHTGDLPFQCANCEKRFTTKGQMTAHMVIHTNSRPYQCDVCAKTFPRSGTLKIHMRFHTNERPYQCTICSKAFHSATLRSTHEKTHTGNTRKYTCSYCGKVYVSHKFYKAHIRLHEEHKLNFMCPTCGECFINSTRMNKHVLLHMKDLVPAAEQVVVVHQ